MAWDSNSAQSPSWRLQMKHYKLPETSHIQNNMCCGRVNRCIKSESLLGKRAP